MYNQTLSMDAKWDYSLTRKCPGIKNNLTFEEFSNNFHTRTKDLTPRCLDGSRLFPTWSRLIFTSRSQRQWRTVCPLLPRAAARAVLTMTTAMMKRMTWTALPPRLATAVLVTNWRFSYLSDIDSIARVWSLYMYKPQKMLGSTLVQQWYSAQPRCSPNARSQSVCRASRTDDRDHRCHQSFTSSPCQILLSGARKLRVPSTLRLAPPKPSSPFSPFFVFPLILSHALPLSHHSNTTSTHLLHPIHPAPASLVLFVIPSLSISLLLLLALISFRVLTHTQHIHKDSTKHTQTTSKNS